MQDRCLIGPKNGLKLTIFCSLAASCKSSVGRPPTSRSSQEVGTRTIGVDDVRARKLRLAADSDRRADSVCQSDFL